MGGDKDKELERREGAQPRSQAFHTVPVYATGSVEGMGTRLKGNRGMGEMGRADKMIYTSLLKYQRYGTSGFDGGEAFIAEKFLHDHPYSHLLLNMPCSHQRLQIKDGVAMFMKTKTKESVEWKGWV